MVFANKFTEVENPQNLLPILEQRFPVSCTMMTLVLSHKKYGKDMDFFFFGSGERENDTWIIVKWYREDWNFWLGISPPKVVSEDGSFELFQKALLSGEIIDWGKRFIITPMLEKLAKSISELILKSTDSVVTSHPVMMYYMTPEQGLKLEIKEQENVRVGPLDAESGVPFVVDNWPFLTNNQKEKTNSVVRKMIEEQVSSGVYVTDETTGAENLVCSAVFAGNGQLSMLHTDSKHRRKGYALRCIQYMFKNLAREGLFPVVSGESENSTALNLYKSIKGIKEIPHQFAFMCIETKE